ncbi:DUF3618 domain-containing protein [Pseudomonas sp. v388]|uniref:DUF3618 domain-containing protein n=1 Tax=Pseudomonas sp. v388 TaxID=2479849 RepID=UPI000F782FD8|nr:DUF3618 domain-containing protein [Pseudomonas sp. v388]RRV03771.1 DUF3618 domain-containing protein [Pseudomonas sp. v388]
MSTSFETESQKSPETLEQEIDAKRASISNIVDSLESRFTPGQLFDQVLTYTKGNGGEFFQNLGTTLKNNPVPTVLTGIGLTWLALNQNKPFAAYPVSSGPGLGEKLSNVAGQVASAFGQVSNSVHNATAAVTDKAHALTDKAHTLKDKASGLHQGASESLGSSASQARNLAHDANAQLHAQTAQLKGQFDTLLKEQPLVLAAIGIALGAALGAALPSTRKEDELLGRTSDKLTSTLKAKGQEAYAGVKDTVKQTAEAAKSGSRTDSDKEQTGTDISPGKTSDSGIGIGIGSTETSTSALSGTGTGSGSGTTTGSGSGSGVPPKPVV